VIEMRNPKMEYMPDGKDLVQGDTNTLPNQGTGTAVGNSYGVDIGVDSINRTGSAVTKSDPMFDNMPPAAENL
jgi:hypothetical protein